MRGSENVLASTAQKREAKSVFTDCDSAQIKESRRRKVTSAVTGKMHAWKMTTVTTIASIGHLFPLKRAVRNTNVHTHFDTTQAKDTSQNTSPPSLCFKYK